MNYDNYFVNSENVMTLDDIKIYAQNKESAYILMRRENSKGEKEFRLEKCVLLNIHKREGFFEEDDCETILSVITLSDELHTHFLLSDMGEKYVILKQKPGEGYLKIFVENYVTQGKYCNDCKYCFNHRLFCDENMKYHNGPCFLFLTYLDFDKKIGEMIKCDTCMKNTK